MKRNKESKSRIRLINYKHLNKARQKELDDMVEIYNLKYFKLYKFAISEEFIDSEILIKMIDYELGQVAKSFYSFGNECEKVSKSIGLFSKVYPNKQNRKFKRND